MRLNNVRKSIPHKNDELYTPKILVNAILPYVTADKVIWCPFDTEESEFVYGFKQNGNKCIYSHINTGQDFFKYEPAYYDYIISNPPFSLKLKVFDRLYKLNKPFAMVMGLPVLNYQEVGKFFYERNSDLQLLIVDKKVSFNGNTASFNNSFFCRNLLPKDIIFSHLEHNNSNKKYTPSRMYGKTDLF